MKRIWKSLSIIIPDKIYLKIMFFKHLKRNIDFENVRTLNEKIQWLKLNDRKKEYIEMVDKYMVRDYIKCKIGEKYLIPLIGKWDKFEDIDFENLPEKFVLKCNHDSKSVFICKDKNKFDCLKAKKILSKNLKRNGYWYGREWPYKNVTPCIIAEKYMVDESGYELKDYKIMCFNGEPDNIMVCYDRDKGAKFEFFDLEWNKLNYDKNCKDIYIEKPKNLNEMIEIARILSKNTYFTRIDLYNIKGKVYFGEITFYPASGFDKDITYEADCLLGDKLKL